MARFNRKGGKTRNKRGGKRSSVKRVVIKSSRGGIRL